MPEEPGDAGEPAPSGIATELAAAGFEEARQVARGGAGVIYCCYETALGRNVAVKVLPSHFDEDSRERFLREGYAMGGLSGHPNIVNILRVGVTPSGKPYIVMPYHSADSLAVRLRREGPIAWPEVLHIGVKLCGALETAHRSGTLHRDIKPANILVNDYGEPQLSDFGIAHIEGGYETATGFFSGTIDYTAPEVMTGNAATVAADMYSLGATLYALIAGNAAHERKKGEDLVAQYLRISTTKIPDLRPEGIPDAVCSAIEKAMAIDPAERPASAEEFGRELQAAQRRNGLKPDAMAISGRPLATPTDVFPAAGGPSELLHSVTAETSSAPLAAKEPARHDGPTAAVGAPVDHPDSLQTDALLPPGPAERQKLSEVGHNAATQPNFRPGADAAGSPSGSNGGPSVPTG
ncbi:serine/threonine-protein kinase, partial [Mycobacterium sp. Marseille-P9652]|uniref:serine/threonine-protein kinase n=1 Tax=Mycobacterium sp. Marseille-P9652 TaxID=2654950 RepID=UPI0012E91EF2